MGCIRLIIYKFDEKEEIVNKRVPWEKRLAVERTGVDSRRRVKPEVWKEKTCLLNGRRNRDAYRRAARTRHLDTS